MKKVKPNVEYTILPYVMIIHILSFRKIRIRTRKKLFGIFKKDPSRKIFLIFKSIYVDVFVNFKHYYLMKNCENVDIWLRFGSIDVKRLFKIFKNVNKLGFYGHYVKDSDIVDLVNLKGVFLPGTNMTDGCLEYFKNVRMLNLDEIKIGDNVNNFEHLKNVKYLSLRSTNVTDNHLKYMEGVMELNINSTKVKGPGLKHLKNVVKLDLGLTNVDDEGILNLHLRQKTPWVHMTHLSVHMTEITYDSVNCLMLLNLRVINCDDLNIYNFDEIDKFEGKLKGGGTTIDNKWRLCISI